jgi:hypothetical protein
MAYSDCWSDVLRAKYLTSLVLFHDYRKGLYTPGLDQYTRTATMVADKWQSGEPGKAIVPRDGGYTYVADGGVAPELRLTGAGTIIVFVRPGGWPYTGARRLVYKVTAAAGYDFYIGNATQLILGTSAGASLESVGSTLANNVMVGVSWTSGVVPRFYGNGVFRAVGIVAAVTTAETSTLFIGNAAGGLLLPLPVQSVLLFNEQLTGAEISQLHNDFLASGFAL